MLIIYLFVLLLALTTQMKSLDIKTFFLPYFLRPNPAGILAANLKVLFKIQKNSKASVKNVINK